MLMPPGVRVGPILGPVPRYKMCTLRGSCLLLGGRGRPGQDWVGGGIWWGSGPDGVLGLKSEFALTQLAEGGCACARVTCHRGVELQSGILCCRCFCSGGAPGCPMLLCLWGCV